MVSHLALAAASAGDDATAKEYCDVAQPSP